MIFESTRTLWILFDTDDKTRSSSESELTIIGEWIRKGCTSINPQTPQCIYTMYIYTLCNTPYIHCSATTMYIGYTMYIQRKNVTQCIYTMYINMLHNVYWECTTMYIGTMLPDAHLQRISKCNTMYIKCNTMYIAPFWLVVNVWGGIYIVLHFIYIVYIHCSAFGRIYIV